MMVALRSRAVALALALGMLVLGAVVAAAQTAPDPSYETALQGFTTDNFNDTDTAIAAVATSGHPFAIQVIEALQAGRLLFSAEQKKVFVRDSAGAFLDAATGQPTATTPSDLRPVRLNNRIRRSIDAARGSMTLLSPDPARRLDAARAVFKSRDANALPALDAAIQKETNPTVKKALVEARAAVILLKPDASEADRIEAIGVLRQRGDQEALAVLSSVPPDAPELVRRSAADAISAI